jgi:hypothetical protein
MINIKHITDWIQLFIYLIKIIKIKYKNNDK